MRRLLSDEHTDDFPGSVEQCAPRTALVHERRLKLDFEFAREGDAVRGRGRLPTPIVGTADWIDGIVPPDRPHHALAIPGLRHPLVQAAGIPCDSKHGEIEAPL